MKREIAVFLIITMVLSLSACGKTLKGTDGLIEKAREENIELEQISEFQAIAGYGVSAVIKETRYLIGNKKLMVENNIGIPKEDDEEKLVTEGNSILYVAQGNKRMSLIGVKDVIKEESKKVVEDLSEKEIQKCDFYTRLNYKRAFSCRLKNLSFFDES